MYPQSPEKNIIATKSWVANGYEPLCGCSEPNPGPLPEQRLLLTTSTDILPKIFHSDKYILSVFQK